jgi:signal transduction histidine kinase
MALNAQYVADATHDLTIREAAEDMTRSAARMGRLLTDLLDVVRIESGTLRVNRRPHDLCALAREVLRSYRPLFASRGLTLSAEVPADALFASFDHDRVVQVLSNLLGDARKFTPAPGTVDLRLARAGDSLTLSLRDSGIGIRPSALPHIFERFWQRDGDERRGLGLGLYICECIMHAHDGSISVESSLGTETTFRLTFPAL